MGQKRFLCPYHAIMYAAKYIKYEDFYKYQSDINEIQKCEICGEPAVLFKDGRVELKLCRHHLERLLKRNLTPKDFFKLYNRAGGIFLLHDDFYDSTTGEAVQPFKKFKRSYLIPL